MTKRAKSAWVSMSGGWVGVRAVKLAQFNFIVDSETGSKTEKKIEEKKFKKLIFEK